MSFDEWCIQIDKLSKDLCVRRIGDGTFVIITSDCLVLWRSSLGRQYDLNDNYYPIIDGVDEL